MEKDSDRDRDVRVQRDKNDTERNTDEKIRKRLIERCG